MKIALAYDPGGEVLVPAVKKVLEERGIPYVEYGRFESDTTNDYPLFGWRASMAVAKGECDRAILMCGTGVGMSMVANKVDGVRCCCCSDCFSIKMSRAHNDCNVLALGGRVVAPHSAEMLVEYFLDTPFEGGRHQRRIDLFKLVEQGQPLE